MPTSKPTILLVSSSSGSRGGGEIFLYYLALGLQKLGIKIHYWCSDHPSMDDIAEKMETCSTVWRHPYTNLYRRKLRALQSHDKTSNLKDIANSWKDLNPNAILINKQNLEDGLDLLQLAHQSNVRTACLIHITQSMTELGAQFAPLRDKIALKTLKAIDIPYIAVSDQRKKSLQDTLQKTVTCIYNGVLTPSSYQRPSTQKSLQVLMVGRMTAQKNPELFLEIASQASPHQPELRFLWIGSGDLDTYFQQQIAARGLEAQCQQIPWTNDVAQHYRQADIYLHTARYEGLPLSILEAMSHHLPCVLAPEILKEAHVITKSHCLTIDPKHRWISQLSDYKTRMHYAAQAHALHQHHFTIEKMACDYATLLL